MKTEIHIRALTTNNVLPIDAERFEFLKRLKNTLNEAFAIEEKYEIVVSNYLDLEEEAIKVPVSNMITDRTDHIDFFETILALNKRVLNLLTTVRLYNDQVASHVAACTGDVDTKEHVKNAQKQEYDENVYYRFMEALRNHAQHYGAPVHRVSLGSRWDEEQDFLIYSLDLVSEKEKLELNKKFKKSILTELGDQIHLLHAIRSYVESLSNIHSTVRDLIDDDVEVSRFKIEEALSEYNEKFNNKKGPVVAYWYEDEVLKEQLLLSLNWDDVRKRVAKKNRKLTNLSKRYPSGVAHNN